MKAAMKNFLGAILAALTGALVLCFIFTGALSVSTGMSGFLSRSYAMEEALGTADLVAAVHLRSGEAMEAGRLVKSLSGKKYSVRVRKVELCSGADARRDVTEKALSRDGNELTFPKSGAYRVSLYIGLDQGTYTEETFFYAVEGSGPLMA